MPCVHTQGLFSPTPLPDAAGGPEAGQFQKEVESLPPELRHYIQEDNWRLEQEAEEWEEEQSCKIPQMEPSPASESQDLSSESGPGKATPEVTSWLHHEEATEGFRAEGEGSPCSWSSPIARLCPNRADVRLRAACALPVL